MKPQIIIYISLIGTLPHCRLCLYIFKVYFLIGLENMSYLKETSSCAPQLSCSGSLFHWFVPKALSDPSPSRLLHGLQVARTQLLKTLHGIHVYDAVWTR